MGKYMHKSELKRRNQDDTHIFRVKINIHGRRHTEYYSIESDHLDMAVSFGLFNIGDDDYVEYFDWKPMKVDYLIGGVKHVEDKWEDDTYFYVLTDDENIYSLPKYLRKRLPSEDFILFGKRKK